MKLIKSILLLLVMLQALGCMVSTNFDEESKKQLNKEEVCEHECEENGVVEITSSESTDNFYRHAFLSWLPYSFTFAYYGIGLIVGLFIFRDASQREWLAFKIKPFWWAAIVFIEPPLGILCYWIIHYSSFAIKENEK